MQHHPAIVEIISVTERPEPKPDPRRARIANVVAGAFGVSASALSARTRGRAKAALARQTAMYLAHVVLGMTLSEAGALFRRDRTTAAHACRLVEDLRDEKRFDALLSLLEQQVAADIGMGSAR